MLSYSEAPPAISAAVVRSPFVLVAIHPMAQLFPPAVALCLRLSQPLVISPSTEFGWSAGCFPAKCVCVHLRTWYDHRTDLPGYHRCMWPLFLVTNMQHLFLGGGGTKHMVFSFSFHTLPTDKSGGPKSLAWLFSQYKQAYFHSFFTEENITVNPYVSAVLYCMVRAEYDYVALLVCFLFCHRIFRNPLDQR